MRAGVSAAKDAKSAKSGGRVSPRAARRMKPSGIPWLREVPAEWNVSRLGFAVEKIVRKFDKADPPLICTNKGKVVFRTEATLGQTSDREDGFQGVQSGDLCIHGMDTWHGAIAVSDISGKCTTVVHVCRSERNDVRFISLYLQALAFLKVYKAFSNGVRQNTSDFRSWKAASRIPVLLPSLPEQRAISACLDGAVARIDALREKIKCEIDRLGDYKKSLIAEMVTKGLRNRKMKPSGISWLGDVPEGWEVVRIGYLANRKPPQYAPEEELLSVFLDRGVIRFVDGGSKRANVASGDFSKYQLVEPGDFVLNNQQAWRGSVGVSSYSGIISPAYLILKLKDGIDAAYANYLFRSKPLVALYEQCSHGVGSRRFDTHCVSN